MNYLVIEQKIYQWAIAQADVQALVIIGSRARKSQPADKWSDLDCIMFVSDPQRYSSDSGWLTHFDHIWFKLHNLTEIGDPEWLVLYESGIKVDFLLAPVSGSLQEMLFQSKYVVVTSRGVRVLVNKLNKVDPPISNDEQNIVWQRPDEEGFQNFIQQFWLNAYKAALMLMRLEMWRAKNIIDCRLRQDLLRLLQWQAKAVNGDDYDVWHDGRYLWQWADPQYVQALSDVFASNDFQQTRLSFFRLLDLGGRLGKEVADLWDYHYPTIDAAKVFNWIVKNLPEP